MKNDRPIDLRHVPLVQPDPFQIGYDEIEDDHGELRDTDTGQVPISTAVGMITAALVFVAFLFGVSALMIHYFGQIGAIIADWLNLSAPWEVAAASLSLHGGQHVSVG